MGRERGKRVSTEDEIKLDIPLGLDGVNAEVNSGKFVMDRRAPWCSVMGSEVGRLAADRLNRASWAAGGCVTRICLQCTADVGLESQSGKSLEEGNDSSNILAMEEACWTEGVWWAS